MKKFDKFTELILNQFEYGGKKYSFNEQKECTDILFDKYGKNWLIGTINKYTFRYNNLKRERDLLKISTYMYIIWLKRGFFIQSRGVVDSIDTNVIIKKNEFKKFTEKIWKYFNTYKEDLNGVKNKIELTSDILQEWANKDWKNIFEAHIFEIYCLMFIEWLLNFSRNRRHDEDVKNEEK